MALNFNPPLTDVFKNGEPVQKGQLSALFGVLRDAVNSLELFLQDVGVWTVTAVGGTANAITGTLGFAEDADTVILLVPLADNGPGGVTLKLGSGPTRGIQKTDGTGLAPGDLKQGQPVMLRVTAAGPWRVIASGVLWSAVMAAVDAEAAARISATRDTGVLPLANVAGTANAVTADIAPGLGGVTLSTLSTVELIPSADNTGPVTLAVGGSAPWPVSRRDGTPLQAGDLKTNVSYLLRRRSNTWRLIGEAASEAQRRVEEAASIIRLSGITGSDAIQASTTGGIALATGHLVALTPAAPNTAAAPTLTVAGVTRTITGVDGRTLGPGDLIAGRTRILRVASATEFRTELQGVPQPISHAVQTGASLPARPNATVVYWHCWDDPSNTGAKLMGPLDLWFAPEIYPSALGPLDPAAWRVQNMRDGARVSLEILQPPGATNPAVVDYAYRLITDDGAGGMVEGPAVSIPIAIGETVVSGLTDGTVVGFQVKASNYLGGTWSQTKSVLVSSADFTDDFNRPNQTLRNSLSWTLNNRDLQIINNQLSARTGNNNWAFQANVNEYFPPDQFVEADVIELDATTRLPALPMRLLLRGDHGLRIRTGNSWAIMRADVVLAQGTFTGTLPLKARLELRGNTLTALINGVVVGTASAIATTGGGPGVHIQRDSSAGSIIDNFRAGRLV